MSHVDKHFCVLESIGQNRQLKMLQWGLGIVTAIPILFWYFIDKTIVEKKVDGLLDCESDN